MLSISEAALRLGISEQTIKNWGERGLLTLTKVGRSYCVDETHLENIKKGAPELLKQMRAAEVLRDELERTSRTYMDEIKEYKLEMMMRKESTQRINLYMEIFASLTDLIYEGRYDEREYKAMVMFLKGHPIKEIADNLGSSKQTIVADIRKCNEILFNLQPYTKMHETNRESNRKARVAEKKEQILRTMLDVCRVEGTTFLDNFQEDDIEKMMTPIEDLNLSLKTKRALSNGRIKYLGDIISYGEERLIKISGFGPTSLQETKEWMARYNLSTKMRIPAWDAIKQAYAKQTPYIYEKLFKLDAETEEYLETCIEGLSEDRATEIRELFLGLFAMGEQYKNNFTKYKQINLALRDEILRMEKCLKNEDYYLSPAYEEVKKLFANAERMKERKEKYNNGEEHPESVEKAIGILDCIFSQQALRAESERMKKDEQTMAELKQKVRKLESRLNEKAYFAKQHTEKETEKQEQLHIHSEYANQEKMKTLKAELEKVRKEKDYLEKQLAKSEKAAETEAIKQLRKERDEAQKDIERKNLEIKQLQFEKKSRDLTIETLSQIEGDEKSHQLFIIERENRRKAEEQANLMELERNTAIKMLNDLKQKNESITQQHVNAVKMERNLNEHKVKLLEEQQNNKETKEQMLQLEKKIKNMKKEHKNELHDLWTALCKYEVQAKNFNRGFFFSKLLAKLKLYSDYNRKKLLHPDDK